MVIKNIANSKDIKIKDGIIVEIGDSLVDKDVYDANNLRVLPMSVDLNVKNSESITKLNQKALNGGVGTFLMIPQHKPIYNKLHLAYNITRDKDVDLLTTADYESIDDFEEEIEEWLEDYKEDFLPLLKTSLTTGKSSFNPIDKDMLEQNKSSITVRVHKFFNKVPNVAPKPVDIDKTVYPWISITAKGIELDRQKIVKDSEISEDELNKYLKDNNWDKLKDKLHKQFGMVQVKNASMIETLISRLTIILLHQ